MKRERNVESSTEKESMVSKIWPIFWKQCANCDSEFRRETGWKYFHPARVHHGIGHHEYICNCCAPDEDYANYIARKCNLYSPRPSPPPNPPPKTP